MKDKSGGKRKGAGGVLHALFRTRYGLLGVAASVAGAAVSVYLFRSYIASSLTSAQESVLSTLGLGLAPVAAWLAVFVAALAMRRSWFSRANLWFASLPILAFVLGLMAFFQPFDGPLSRFTLGGDVSLGGQVGSAIAGSTDWLGGLRLTGLLIMGAAVALPGLAMDLATIAGKLLVFAYVYSVVGLKGLASTLRNMYRFEPARRDAPAPADPVPPSPAFSLGLKEAPEPLAPSADPKPRATAADPSPLPRREVERSHAISAVPRSEVQVVRLESEGSSRAQADVTQSSTGLANREPSALETISTPEVEAARGSAPALSAPSSLGPASAPPAEADEAATHAGGKFNKFWSDRYSASEDAGLPAKDEEDRVDGEVEAKATVVDSTVTSWDLPPIDLLTDAPEGGISEAQMAETAEVIRRTLAEYAVEVEIGQVSPGPTVTMYGLIPGWVRRYKQVKVTDESGQPKRDESGKPIITRVETKTRVKVDSIMSREKDLSLALKTPSIRIETPAMGESLVGIEVPNPRSSLVTLRGVMESDEFRQLRAKANLPIALGKGSGGETMTMDLASMPHLLIAGATGSGKSVCINTIVSCLIREKSPAEMRLLLIDPKRVELTPYNGIPHLLEPVVVETDQVVSLLKGMIREMLSRYRRMEEVSVRNIVSYNSKMPDKMPYLVVAIDELADLMMSASFDVEQSLCRLAQLGRATGIHLIVATQRPSVDVVTGLIKANFPTRISFGVTSQIDSRTILDTAGAEKLLGKGDMLYLAVDGARPERVQGVFISDTEVDALVRFWHTTPWAPMSKVSLHTVGDGPTEDDEAEDDGSDDRDELLDSAIDLAQRNKKLSTSLLQRRLRIGYPRAARLMDQLEEEGVVGPIDGSKSRDVIMSGT